MKESNAVVPIPTQSNLTLEDMLAHPEIKISIMRPTYLSSSAWLEHIPFAFWITKMQKPKMIVELGTHYGASYFAFCQAVQHLALDARCYAVDTWKGDQHAGFYGEEVYQAVRVHNDEMYSRFSSLIRSTFDDASQYFSDGSIDLLHIDGLHTLEAVQHDFDTWHPKMSKRGVMLLHDTNVRERGFGVSLLLQKLRKNYPVFEFDHGHGLAVVAVGGVVLPEMQVLFAPPRKEDGRHCFAEYFARLGRACSDAYRIRPRNDVFAVPAREPVPAAAVPKSVAVQSAS